MALQLGLSVLLLWILSWFERLPWRDLGAWGIRLCNSWLSGTCTASRGHWQARSISLLFDYPLSQKSSDKLGARLLGPNNLAFHLHSTNNWDKTLNSTHTEYTRRGHPTFFYFLCSVIFLSSFFFARVLFPTKDELFCVVQKKRLRSGTRSLMTGMWGRG